MNRRAVTRFASPLVAALVISALVAPGGGCGDDDPMACGAFAGDPSRGIEAEPFFLVEDAGGVRRVAASDGGPAPLVVPQQGGFVIYAGLRLRHLDPCDVTLTGQLLDESATMALTNRDRRQADLEPDTAPGGDGWMVPAHLDSLATVPNIPACPDALGHGVVDRPAVLDLQVRDRTGRTTTVRRPVVPSCTAGAGEGFCRCTCGPDFFPGKWALDGGVADAGSRDGP